VIREHEHIIQGDDTMSSFLERANWGDWSTLNLFHGKYYKMTLKFKTHTNTQTIQRKSSQWLLLLLSRLLCFCSWQFSCWQLNTVSHRSLSSYFCVLKNFKIKLLIITANMETDRSTLCSWCGCPNKAVPRRVRGELGRLQEGVQGVRILDWFLRI